MAELPILRSAMPRSLAACMHGVVSNLDLVANGQSGQSLRTAGRLHSELLCGRIDEILAAGLHTFLRGFLQRVDVLGVGIGRDSLAPVVA